MNHPMIDQYVRIFVGTGDDEELFLGEHMKLVYIDRDYMVLDHDNYLIHMPTKNVSCMDTLGGAEYAKEEREIQLHFTQETE